MAPALRAIRQRLRTGGYLVILAATETERLHLAFRPGVHIHRRTEWAAQLATTGFGGIDAANPSHEVALSGYSVMVAQALDAELRLLRDPFAATVLPWDRALVILSSEPISPALRPQLSPFFRQIREVFLRPDPDLSVLSASSVILVIQGPTPWTTKQQVLIEECLALSDAPVLWLSEDGGYYDQCGIHDLLATNLTHIRLLHLPDARATEPKFLARLLLQWIHSQCEQPGWSALTGTAENELRLRGDVLEVPRQVPCTTLDCRLHPHQDAVPTEQVQVEHRTSSDNSIHFAVVVSPSVDGDAMNPGHIRLAVKFSTIGAIPVAEECCLHLVLGRNQLSQSRMLTLAGAHRGTVSSPQDWCCEVPGGVCTEQEPTYLADVAAGLSALYLMQHCPPGSVLLVHGASPVERAVITSLASQQTTTVFYSTSRLGKDDDQPQRLFIHAYSANRRLRQQLLPHRITALGCLNPAHDPLLSRIRDALSQEQKRPAIIAAHHFASSKALGLASRPNLGDVLRTVVGLVQPPCPSSSQTLPSVIPVQDLPTYCQAAPATPTAVIDWTAQRLVPAFVRPAHQTITFSPHRSYLLHLSAPLAQLVCDWMASRGAQHVILADTVVDEQWKAEISSRITFLDLSIRDLVELTKSATCYGPTIAGVILGSTDSNTSLRLLSSTNFRPALDFFVALDELSPPVMTPFPSFSAVSAYRTALIQCQRSRGIAASILHHNTALLSESSTTRLRPREIYEAIARAILGARQGDWQITAIMGQSNQGSVSLDDVARHPKMWHFAPDPVASLTPETTDTPLSEDQRMQRALEQTDNLEETIGLMAQAITRRLREQLQLPLEAVPPDDTPLGDLGWDSMMAVKLRVWMGRQLAVDLPVVRMMGGSCIRDVAREAAENFMAKRVRS
ncbi:beta-ketoacyl synthase [Aspergillus terreus]|uniref:Beta-ketoacyl synthase n=1 Tax=Aspergillus terreus TaxID=33178 RepID=A0A5M3Z5Z4_ASPTE|nr:hypothetical protein ATETN484_0010015600 [Aspergillus terreus]GFF18206.1 beta-ketoacyl synthase [Aspergillus terreus]